MPEFAFEEPAEIMSKLPLLPPPYKSQIYKNKYMPTVDWLGPMNFFSNRVVVHYLYTEEIRVQFSSEAIKIIQKKLGLKVDGIWGKDTQSSYMARRGIIESSDFLGLNVNSRLFKVNVVKLNPMISAKYILYSSVELSQEYKTRDYANKNNISIVNSLPPLDNYNIIVNNLLVDWQKYDAEQKAIVDEYDQSVYYYEKIAEAQQVATVLTQNTDNEILRLESEKQQRAIHYAERESDVIRQAEQEKSKYLLALQQLRATKKELRDV